MFNRNISHNHKKKSLYIIDEVLNIETHRNLYIKENKNLQEICSMAKSTVYITKRVNRQGKVNRTAYALNLATHA